MYKKICGNCRYRVPGKKCFAFPSGIPDDIWDGKVLHDKHVEGQVVGYYFELKDHLKKLSRKREIRELYLSNVSESRKRELPNLILNKVKMDYPEIDVFDIIIFDITIFDNRIYKLNEFHFLIEGIKLNLSIPNISSTIFAHAQEIIDAEKTDINRLVLNIKPGIQYEYQFCKV